MSLTDWGIALAALLLIGFINWYFLGRSAPRWRRRLRQAAPWMSSSVSRAATRRP